VQCANCRKENPGSTHFCGHCGAPLPTVPLEGTAELRQLTVLFCDLVGSTSLASSLDPEDLREITSTYQTVCAAAIRRHDGYIAQYLGDGVLVYFGYPVAHEDDARRAVRAALEILRDLAALAGRVQNERGIALNARLGIHTGLVVVGDVGDGERREQLAVGKTPNLAARIQNVATPGTVVVSDDTYRIVRGFFDFSPLGAHEIRGLSEVVTLYLVVGESGADNRLEVARRAGLTPLTGRDEERTLLEQRWSSVSRSGGHTVLVQGEAGIGKSRIVDSLRAQVERQSATVLECFCTPYAQSTPLFPLVGLVERTLGFTRDTSDADKRVALERRLARRGMLTDETSALMAELLTIPAADTDPLVNYSPQKRRERTLETLLALLLTVAHDGPALWIVEDLHWADPTTLEFVSSVLGSLSAEPLLVLLTFRPDFAAPWHANGRVSSMMLTRLTPGETGSMAAGVAHGKAIPAEVLRQIVARAEGVPLFVEEVTKAVLELGVLVECEDRFELSGPLPPDLIPSTVQGSLNARLDRLGPAKATAQLAATIGREFSYELLTVVAGHTEDELRGDLDRLIGAELVYRRADSPEETYLFKHALVRDAAYQSLLKKARRALHQQIAEALVSRFPETAKQHPELVAEHFSVAGRAEQAVKFWLLGGQLAAGRGANQEAITHLNRGLGLVGELPVADRHQQELEFLIALIPALIASEGWASAGLERVYRRAKELADLLGETPHQFALLAGTMGYHFVAGRVEQSLGLAMQLFELSTKVGDPLLLTVGRQNCSAVHCYHGDFRLAIEHAEAGLATLDAERERIIGQTFGLSSCVGLLTYEYIALWMQGFPVRSLRTSERCVALAREIGQPPSIGFALTARAGSAYLQGDAQGTLGFGDEALRVVREERLGFFEPIITVYRGWGLSELGESAEGIVQIRAALERYYMAGNGVQQVWLHVILADVQWKAGEWNDAFGTLASAMALARNNGEGLFEPELYRLEGEFLFAQAMGAAGSSNTASGDERLARLVEAERCIRQSLDMARRQEARMLELRSLVSLCRVRRELGAVSQERDMLAAVHTAFTEGFETPDLREARSMLEALKA
jgi:class 3 adenylate cyclase/tetratricopeptide (TPR) repeat protein